MAGAMTRPDPTFHYVESVRFSFYTPDEIHRMSVKRLTNPTLLDNLNHPLPDGLYDPALGPSDVNASCVTCGQPFTHCPGHFGHIDLPMPVFNPLAFKPLKQILQCICLHCHRSKMRTSRAALYAEKLELLREGRMSEATEVFLHAADHDDKGGDSSDDNHAGDDAGGGHGDGLWGLGRRVAVVRFNAAGGGVAAASPPSSESWTSQTMEASRATIHDFLKAAAAVGKCQNCGAHVPKIKAEGSSKLLVMPLDAKKVAANAAHGIHPPTVIGTSARSASTTAKTAAGDGGDEAIEGDPGEDNGDGEMDTGMDDGGADVNGAGGGAFIAGAASAGGAFAGRAKPAARKAAAAAAARVLTAVDAEAHVRSFFETEPALAGRIFGGSGAGRQGEGKASPGDGPGEKMFFIHVVPVPPNRFRPASKMGESLFEHPQNTHLTRILKSVLILTDMGQATAGAVDADKMLTAYLELQAAVNCLLDSAAAAKLNKDEAAGIKQQLEKKEGLFRKNMMGKRVNFAARTVISPDPYIATNEVGVPPFVAAKLTFPELVTPWNAARLRSLVETGEEGYPGATHLEDERGKVVALKGLSRPLRVALARKLLAGPAVAAALAPLAWLPPADANAVGSLAAGAAAVAAAPPKAMLAKVVHRHLQTGDVVLVNRQPTLHKPGLMAQRAVVLKGQRTIRFHYANCSTFNADFDGDEINLHLPQDQLGRAEAAVIADADEQFFVPTDGKPLRGLIQDHVGAGVLLSQRDTFLPAAAFSQLLYAAVGRQSESTLAAATAGAPPEPRLVLPTPAILRPRRLYTGKQLVTATVAHVTRGAPLTFRAGGKVSAEYWGESNKACAWEGDMRFAGGDLLTGVIDKNTYSKFGLVHAVHETCGPRAAGELLSALSRLCTAYLQVTGFTCPFDHLLLIPGAEAARTKELAAADAGSLGAAAALLNRPELASQPAALANALGTHLRARPESAATLDAKSTGVLHGVTSAAIKACIPAGQRVPFPTNCMSIMTVTGAKGSLVNSSQISALLGQQELEGRRVPRMASGKTLPCFPPFDAAARAGGYITDRFLTGLRVPEYYFHCMAGREGLIDTTVKTSRSGYLQRCMVKNLETLRVHYDSTVRDDADGCVVQFHYGEDGLDTTKTGYLKNFGFLAANAGRMAGQLCAGAAASAMDTTSVDAYLHASRKLRPGKAHSATRVAAVAAAEREGRVVMSRFDPSTALGAVSESYREALDEYMSSNPDGLLSGAAAAAASAGKKDKAKKGKANTAAGAQPGQVDPATFRRLMDVRYACALVAPGEAVGVLAAQSIGEPSTQMTLNTFHFAGRGEANVTLGIPRLRELLMSASPKIKTPVMLLPLKPGLGREAAAALAAKLRVIRLAELLSELRVAESPCAASEHAGGTHARSYALRLTFAAEARFPDGVTWAAAAAAVKDSYLPLLYGAVKAELRRVRLQRRGPAVLHQTARGDDEGEVEGSGGGDNEGAGGRDKDDDAPEPKPKKAPGMAADGEAAGDGDDDGSDGGGADEDGGFAEGAKAEARAGGREDFGGEGDSDGEEDAVMAAAGDADSDGDGGGDDVGDDVAGGEGGEAREAGDEMDDEGAAGEHHDSDGDGGDDDAKADKKKKGKGRGKGKVKAKAKATPVAHKTKARPPAREGILDTPADFGATLSVDTEEGRCSATLRLSLAAPKLLLSELAARIAAAAVVRHTPGVGATYVLPAAQAGAGLASGGAQWVVQTDGINFAGACSHDEVDVSRVRSNHVAAVLITYGIEAARAVLLAETQAVFGAYGIGVSPRHLSLIADFMTRQGDYRPCNRLGIECSPSPFLKMSYETATHFLADATLRGHPDPLATPSARIVLGRPTAVGTGSFGLMHCVDGGASPAVRAAAISPVPVPASMPPRAAAAEAGGKSLAHASKAKRKDKDAVPEKEPAGVVVVKAKGKDKPAHGPTAPVVVQPVVRERGAEKPSKKAKA